MNSTIEMINANITLNLLNHIILCCLKLWKIERINIKFSTYDSNIVTRQDILSEDVCYTQKRHFNFFVKHKFSKWYKFVDILSHSELPTS